MVGSVGLWWLHFDRSAGEAAAVIARSADPGRMGRTAYHLIHPVMVAGIIVVAAGDEVMLSRPGAPAAGSTAWLILGGAALFIAGHAAFKIAVWRVVSWPRVAAIVIFALLGLAAGSLSALGVCAAIVVLGVATADHWAHR